MIDGRIIFYMLKKTDDTLAGTGSVSELSIFPTPEQINQRLTYLPNIFGIKLPRFAIGNSDFQSIIKEFQTLVDKSLFIKAFLEDEHAQVFFFN